MADVLSLAVSETTVGANHNIAESGNGLGGKTYILTVGVGGGAISQAQLNGFVRGIKQGASLQTAATKVDAFTVAAIGAFTAASSTSVVIAVQGTGTPSTTTGDYFAACTVAITATFDQTPA
jgi:hypothetical protein